MVQLGTPCSWSNLFKLQANQNTLVHSFWPFLLSQIHKMLKLRPRKLNDFFNAQLYKKILIMIDSGVYGVWILHPEGKIPVCYIVNLQSQPADKFEPD